MADIIETAFRMRHDMKDDLRKLAVAHRILEMEGHGDMTLGHMSMRDPDGRGIWMKRNAAGLGEILDDRDFVLLDWDGHKLEGAGNPHSEWPIHTEIMLARDDVTVVAHTHPFHCCVFSATDEPLRAATVDANYFELPVPRYTGTAALIKTKALGREMAETLGSNYALLLANHGVTFCGTSIEHATMMGIFIEKACRIQVTLAGSGMTWDAVPPDVAAERRAQIMTDVHVMHSWNYFCRKLDWVAAAGARNSQAIFG